MRSAQPSPAASPGGPSDHVPREELEEAQAQVERLQAELTTANEQRSASEEALQKLNGELSSTMEVSRSHFGERWL